MSKTRATNKLDGDNNEMRSIIENDEEARIKVEESNKQGKEEIVYNDYDIKYRDSFLEEGKEDERKEHQNLQVLINNLGNECDLVSIIGLVNRYMIKQEKKPINKKNLSITLNKDELDKFEEIKNVNDDFVVKIDFLIEG